MLVERVGARLMACGHPVMDVLPVFRRNRVRLDADRFDCIDVAEHIFDLRPAVDLQQDFAAGPHEGQRLVALARLDRAHDVDARDNGTKVVRRPTHESEHGVGAERDDAPAAVEDLFVRLATEPDPVFDLLL